MSQWKLCPPILLFVLGIVATAVVILPKTTQAEIATTHDWIGLFEITTPAKGDSKAETVNGNSWAYANNCTQTAGSSPALANPAAPPATGCNIVPNPLPSSGTYEYRMYANDQENPAALIAISSAMAVTPPSPPPGGAVNCPTQVTNPRVQDGLITTPSISNKFGNRDATCVVGSPAPFVPFKIPGYDDLKSIYYTQSKAPKQPNTDTTLVAVADGNIYNYTNPAGVTAGATGVYNYTGTAVVFIDSNLTISNNITGTAGKGLVLVVGGDITIESTVTQINAVLISAGKIFTAGLNCTQPVNTSQLIVNGSLISLNRDKNIEFCRALTVGNTIPAELINNQPKYLVILRNLYSDNPQKWSELP